MVLIATIDEGDKTGNVHTKEQITELLKNSGKNLGNSDLVIPTGEVRTLDTTGAKLLIKGLENRKNESAFNLRLKANARGELGVSDEKDINIIVSDSFESKITFNHIYPNPVPEKQPYAEAIGEILRNYRTYTFTFLRKEDYFLQDDEDNRNEYEKSIIENNGLVREVKNNTLFTKINFPSNKDFIVEIFGDNSMVNSEIGLGRSSLEFGVL